MFSQLPEEEGTSQKGRKALEGSGKFKDRSGETSGEEIVLPGLHQKRKQATRPEHRLSKGVKNGKTLPKRHDKH